MNYQISEQDVGNGLDRSTPFLAKFLELPSVLYRDKERWGAVFSARSVAPRPAEIILQQIARFAADTARAFLVCDGVRPVARAIGYLDTGHSGGEIIGQIGYFEACEELVASSRLFEAVVSWLRGRGAARIVGPMDGDTWHRYRLNVGPFDHPLFFLEPVNPPFYQSLWESFGFRPLEEYYSMRVDDLSEVATVYSASAEAMRAQGYQTRAIDLSRFEEELTLLFTLTTEIFSGNFLYTPISREEYLKMYLELRPLIQPEFLNFVYSPEKVPVGFLFGIPDLCEGAAPRTLNLKTLGITREHRRAGLAKGLFADAYRTAFACGYKSANLCLIRQGNPSGNLDAGKGRTIRTYLLYELP